MGAGPTERETEGPENHPLHAQTARCYNAWDSSAHGKGEARPKSDIRPCQNSEVQGFPPWQFCLQESQMLGSKPIILVISEQLTNLGLSRSCYGIVYGWRSEKARGDGR